MLNDGLEAMFEGCIIDEIRQREIECEGGGGRGGLVLRPTAETATRRACVCDVLRAAPQCRSRIDSGMPRVWCQ